MDKRRGTIQRQAILDAVRELDIHATAEQAYDYIVKKHPAISKATVYRNLNQMAEAGEIMNIGTIYGSVHYDHNCRSHYHFVCDRCKQVFDVNNYFPGLSGRLTEMDGFKITGHQLIFIGLCRDCNDSNI